MPILSYTRCGITIATWTRRIVGLCLASYLLFPQAAGARRVCGSDAGDATALATIERQIAAQCDCCGLRAQRRPCAIAIIKTAVRSHTLSRRCASRALRDTRVCPLGAAIPCRTCQTDANCGADQFCECAAGTCGAGAGSVCRSLPGVCPQIFLPVCGCDGTTYPNDCQRQAAHACKLHDGACAGPVGRCFVTVGSGCSMSPCDAAHPCRNPNEFCSAACLSTTTTTVVTTTTMPAGCNTNAECDDGNGCTADRCLNGVCEHDCLCVTPDGPACCPGPSTLCARSCGVDRFGVCGGTCPAGATCGGAEPNGCGCVSGVGGPCGGNILASPPVCGPGLVCQQINPDGTGVCVAGTCIPYFQPGCTQTTDCCHPCGDGVIAPCAVCSNGVCLGVP